jgi:hypothetical protein
MSLSDRTTSSAFCAICGREYVPQLGYLVANCDCSIVYSAQQSPQMQWVDVKERMPEPGVDVLVHNSDGCRVAYWHNLYSSLGTWHNRSDSCGCCDDFDRDGVTHWMALPELGKL